MRREVRAEPETFASTLTISVVTLADWPDTDFSLRTDLRRVKAALLYADYVRIYSYVPSLMQNFEALEANGSALDDYLATLPPEVLKHLGLDDPAGEAWRALTKPDRRRIEKRLHRGASTRSQGMADAILKLQTSAWTRASLFKQGTKYAEELDNLIESGFVVVDALGNELSALGDELPSEYAAALDEIICRPSTQPLFDENTSALLAHVRQAGIISPSERTLSHALKIATGVGMIGRLPTFPDASVTDILEAKESLREWVLAYREGVDELTRLLNTDVFDRELEQALDDVYRNNIERPLTDIHRSLMKSRIITQTAKNAIADPKAYMAWFAAGAGSSIALYSPGAAWLSQGGLKSALTGVVATGSRMASTVAQTLIKNREAGEANNLYYLLKIGERFKT